MKFPLVFTRVKPAAAPAITLGADTFPVDSSGAPRKPSATDTNVLFARSFSKNGQPTKRVALVGKVTGNGATPPAALPVSAYVWDDALGFWVLLTSSVANITPGNTTSSPVTPQVPVFFDIPALTDGAPTLSNIQAGTDLGTLAVLFLISDNSSVNGTYIFAAAPILNERAL